MARVRARAFVRLWARVKVRVRVRDESSHFCGLIEFKNR